MHIYLYSVLGCITHTHIEREGVRDKERERGSEKGRGIVREGERKRKGGRGTVRERERKKKGGREREGMGRVIFCLQTQF